MLAMLIEMLLLISMMLASFAASLASISMFVLVSVPECECA